MTDKDKDEIIAKLRSEVEILKTILSIMPGNVYWNDTEGYCLGCNNNNAKLLNLDSPESAIGKSQLELYGPQYAQMLRETDLEILATGKEKSLEEHGFTIGGIPAIYLTKKTPFYDAQGNVRGVLGVSFDITDRKKIEEKLTAAKQKAEAANRAKSSFLAMISHELRTPLTSAIGFASLIQQADLQGEKRKEYLNHIIDSGNYLLSLINSLLDYNKLETNKFELRFLPLNLKELIESVVAMLSSSAELKKLTLSLEYDDNAPTEIMANSRTIRQILINLIGNAIKFTDHGKVTVQVSCIETQADFYIFEITVADTGIGIPASELKSIFKRFYQLGNVYTRDTSYTGTGLGLAIVKKLVKLIGGEITVTSTLNQGSKFTFTAKFPKIPNDSCSLIPDAANVKILVVQDDVGRNFLHNFLANATYDIVSSKEALNTLFAAQQTSNPYKILILDSHLNIKQEELLHLIQDQGELYQPLPILLNSTHSLNTNAFMNIPTHPSPMDLYNFQTTLKEAWEKWQTQNKKPEIEVKLATSHFVLLVEDNPLIQIVHKHLLEDLGYSVDTADSAKQALSLLKNNYDLLIVDIGLPDVSGFELIQNIRSNYLTPEGEQVPIIVLTGYSEEEERQRCLQAGANEVAIKPVSKATLAGILNRYLQH